MKFNDAIKKLTEDGPGPGRSGANRGDFSGTVDITDKNDAHFDYKPNNPLLTKDIKDEVTNYVRHGNKACKNCKHITKINSCHRILEGITVEYDLNPDSDGWGDNINVDNNFYCKFFEVK